MQNEMHKILASKAQGCKSKQDIPGGTRDLREGYIPGRSDSRQSMNSSVGLFFSRERPEILGEEKEVHRRRDPQPLLTRFFGANTF